MIHLAALDGQVTSWLDLFGPFLFYALVWGLVFAGTDLGWWAGAVGRFIPWGRKLVPPIAGILSRRRNRAAA